MTRLLLQRADEVAAGVPRSETSLVIVGHGTNLNDNSTKAIQDQVKLIREGSHGFAEVIDAYMEEAPLVADWDKLTTAPNVVVVPFFIADGLHSFQDIPVLLGIEQEPGRAMSELDVFRNNPIPLRGRQLYYSQAIGTEALMADVILDQVADFDARYDTVGLFSNSAEKTDSSRRLAMLKWLDEGRDVIGQILIRRQGESFSLCHLEDENSSGLQAHATVEAARELARHNESGAFRPIKTAPDLRRGWQLNLTGLENLLLALEFFYPAAVGLAQAEEAGTLRTVPLRNLLARQTGMYRFANNITDEQACEIIGSKCRTSTHCLRRIVFGLNEGQSFHGAAIEKLSSAAGGVPKGLNEKRAIPLLCMEACNHIVSTARSVARKSYEEKSN
jgi:sirohydrochlorin cobaltochelatase